jgi:hypothetical protein
MHKPHAFLVSSLALCLSGACTSKPNFEIVEPMHVEDITEPVETPDPRVDVDVGLIRPNETGEVPSFAFKALVVDPLSHQKPLAELDSVDLNLDFVGAFAGAQVSVEFVEPGGSVYERRTVSLNGNVFEKQQVQFRLPVAGTLIEQMKLEGLWQARFELDGIELQTQTFELRP